MTTILVVDDEYAVLSTIEELLEMEGYEVLTANNGLTALDVLETQIPDLILCDVTMPGMDGMEFLQRLRLEPEKSTIPFIFLTARIATEVQRKGMNLGANDFITKPFSSSDLLASVRSRLDQQAHIQNYTSQKLEQLRRNLTVALPHELRTPLQGIITSAELLSEYWETLETEDIREIAGNIKFSANRLNDLIQKFLLYVKLDLAVHDPEEFHQWYFGTTGNTALVIMNAAERIAAHHGRQGDLQLSLGEGYVAIAEKWLSTLVTELIDNAFKFSQLADGDLPSQDRSVNVLTTVKDNFWQLKISDHGRGMTQQQIRSIGAYMQFDRSQFEQQGSGLGLAIAERIVKIYNGTMTIDSRVNRGTIITVCLPLRDESEIEDDLIIG